MRKRAAACDPCPDCNCGRLTAAAEVDIVQTNMQTEIEMLRSINRKLEASTIERCAQRLKRLTQYEFGGGDQFALGFNEGIREAETVIRALKDKP